MRHGLRVSFALSEFATAAALITFAACSIIFYMTRHATEPAVACVPKETTVVNHYITVPAPIVRVRVVVSKPDTPVVTIVPKLEPIPQSKVWDNDNLPHESDPPRFLNP